MKWKYLVKYLMLLVKGIINRFICRHFIAQTPYNIYNVMFYKDINVVG